MKVSRNELRTALMRAYEGAAYAIGDYEEAAELITWSEMCGLGGLAEANFPPAAAQSDHLPRIDYEANGIAVIDAGATDVCQYGSLAANLASTLAIQEGLASVHLTDCTNPKLILGALAKIAGKGFYLSAYWQHNGNRYGASFDGGSEYPEYWVIAADDNSVTTGQSSITILCTQQAGLLANIIRKPVINPNREIIMTSADALAMQYDSSLNQGIEVDPDQWAALNQAAWPILVPTSQHSSLGAGPG